jgi:hypothetical protein
MLKSDMASLTQATESPVTAISLEKSNDFANLGQRERTSVPVEKILQERRPEVSPPLPRVTTRLMVKFDPEIDETSAESPRQDLQSFAQYWIVKH